MTTGERIRTIRKAKGMTQEQLGELIGVKKAAINKYEKDKINLKASTLAAIAKALGVSPVSLLSDDEVDEDQQRLEALHQNPRLGLLFDRSRKMTHEDVEFMLQMADRILKERDGE